MNKVMRILERIAHLPSLPSNTPPQEAEQLHKIINTALATADQAFDSVDSALDLYDIRLQELEEDNEPG